MICQNCGKETDENAVVCPECGSTLKNEQAASENKEFDPVMQQADWQAQQKRMQAEEQARQVYVTQQSQVNRSQYSQSAGATPYGTTEQLAHTKREFLRLPQNNNLRKGINTAAIICYICFAATAGVALISKNNYQFIDAGIILAMGLGIHIGKSIVCSILLLAYGAYNVIYVLATQQKFSGWWVAVAGLFAVIYTIQISKKWREYKKANLN